MKVKLFKGHTGDLLTFDDYKKHAKVESFNNLNHSCLTFLYNKNYKKDGIPVLPPRWAITGPTKEQSLLNAYKGYVLIYECLNN